MSRAWYGIALLCVASTCGAQQMINHSTSGDVQHSASDPQAVEVPMYKGAQIEAVLAALKAKGFRIKWSAEQVLPTMTVLDKPKSTRIDLLLREILAPWDLQADHNAVYGEYRVRPVKKKPKK